MCVGGGGVYVHEFRNPQRPKTLNSPEAAVAGSCELSIMGAEN